MNLSCWSLAAALFFGCGGGLPYVVEGRDVSAAGGAPSVNAIVDLGGRTSTRVGRLRPDGPSDGVAAIGELLWLRGGDLGRMPRVSIAGQPATTEAYTTDGILVRVPPGVPAGRRALVIEHSRGRDERDFPIRRWALVLADGRIHPVALDGAGVVARAPIAVPGAHAVRFAPEGSVAYVLGQDLTLIDVAAQQGPRAVARRKLPIAARHVAVARERQAARGALISASEVAMMDLTLAYQPAFWSPRPLPQGEAGDVTRAELDDEGGRLALLDGNRVALIDVSDVAAPGREAVVDLLPGVRPPLGTHLRFAGKGAFWVLAGNNPRSAATGGQPLRLVRVHDGVVEDPRVLGSGTPAGLEMAPEKRRVRGSNIGESMMPPVLVAFSGEERTGGVLRVDGEGADTVIETEETVMAMAAAADALVTAVCREGRLGVIVSGGDFVSLDASCQGPVDVVVQP